MLIMIVYLTFTGSAVRSETRHATSRVASHNAVHLALGPSDPADATATASQLVEQHVPTQHVEYRWKILNWRWWSKLLLQ